MSYQHRELAGGRWNKLTLCEQMANIGSEVERAINWRGKNIGYNRLAAERALELAGLTIADPKNQNGGLKELTRLYELLVDYFFGENKYGSSDKSWRSYFYAFNFAARRKLDH
ncbi:hypothetical protein HZB78_00130 [Candidatus Collierbacteria bacterium]|nr:hypothetical protein [Candidatus Collierbacteria bacterium]